ncbi:MAG: YbaB/EbfC family nucleoid-associated protein [Bacilli bacterium]|nr:YbaB/EbfC family nucleoid-associated protein [Bacilli bacterium]
MNMQQMMIQAQKMQREMEKALAALAKQEFTVSKAGLVTVTVLGSKQIKSVNIDKDGFDPENKEMIEELIATALNEIYSQIDEQTEAIQSKITGRGGLPF